MTPIAKVSRIVLIACTASSPAFAENWNVYEGVKGSTNGVWAVTVDNNKIVGHAQMATITNAHINYTLNGVIDSGVYRISSTLSDDKIGCRYLGSLSPKGDKISGTSVCGGESSPWTVIFGPNLNAGLNNN